MRTTCNYKRHLQDFQHWLTLCLHISLLLAAATTTTCRSSQHQARLGWAKDAVNRSLTLLRAWVNILTFLSAKADPIKSYCQSLRQFDCPHSTGQGTMVFRSTAYDWCLFWGFLWTFFPFPIFSICK